MADREFKFRFDVEGDDIKRELREQNDQLDEAARRTERQGRAADQASPRMSRFGRAIRGVGGSLRSVVTAWASLAAVSAAILAFFRDLAATAQKAMEAIQQVGQMMQGLAANVGGERADRIKNEMIDPTARQLRLSREQRNKLIAATAGFTDFHADASDEQIAAAVRDFAALEKATGGSLSGDDLFKTRNALSANLGMTGEQATDAAVTMLNSGFDAQTIQQLASRGGNVGGLDFVALMLAARKYGLNLQEAGRGSTTLITALTRRDAGGNLAPELQAAGIGEAMNINARIATLVAGRDAGQLSQGQFEAAIGGAQNLRYIGPMSRALRDPDEVARAMNMLRDDQAAENAIKSLLQSEYIQALDRANARQFAQTATLEQSGMGGVAENTSAQAAALRIIGDGSMALGVAKMALRGFFDPPGAIREEARAYYEMGMPSPSMTDEGAARAVGVSVEEYRRRTGAGVTINNDRRTQYIGVEDMMTAPSDRGAALD